MMDPAAVAALVRRFEAPGDGEALKSRDLVLMLLACAPEPFSRHHFTPGHVTATGLVLGLDGRQILLVHHRRLDRWLTPGGHVEPEDAGPGEAARREVIEETGVSLLGSADSPLVGIDVHGIPAKGAEPYHLHHDLLFLFRAAAEGLQVSAESHDAVWCGPDQFDHYGVPANIRRAYARVLSTE